MKYYIGLDLGTSSVKAVLFDGKNVVNESLVDQFAEAHASKRGL